MLKAVPIRWMYSSLSVSLVNVHVPLPVGFGRDITRIRWGTLLVIRNGVDN